MVASRPETEWDALQRAWMIALGEYRATRCKGCGNNVEETTGPQDGLRWQVRRVRCWACHDLEAAHLVNSKTDKPETYPGARLMWVEKAR